MNPDERSMLPPQRKKSVVPPGKKFMIGIGIKDYKFANELPNAVNDLNAIAELLIKEYDFDRANVHLRTNQTATAGNIIKLFETFAKPGVLGPNDSLLIYYAGHGYLNVNKRGYWVPVEGKIDNVVTLINNVVILDYISQFKCRHVLLISDSCYSGSLISRKAKDEGKKSVAEEVEKLNSRYVLSSGRPYETARDSTLANPNNSPFAAAILSTLSHNANLKLAADKLYIKARKVVWHNAPQLPQYKVIMDAGDLGGQFVFTRRDIELHELERARKSPGTNALQKFIKEHSTSKYVSRAEEYIRKKIEKEKKTIPPEQIPDIIDEMEPTDKAYALLTQKTYEWATNRKSWWYLLNFFDWLRIEKNVDFNADWGDNGNLMMTYLRISRKWWYTWIIIGMLLLLIGLAYIGYLI